MEQHLLEAFALAKDRTKALEQLIPGTEDYYFHACLLHEQAGNFKEVDSLMQQWNKRYGETQRFQEIRNRRALMRYEKEPKETAEYLRVHLGLDFSHERVVDGNETKYPSKLDNKLVSRAAIKEQGWSWSNSSDLSGFSDHAIEWLLDDTYDGQRLRNLLQRVRRPDHPKLIEHLVTELNDRHSSGFGALPIHNVLLQEQLEKLAKAIPALMQVDAFVNAWIVKLQPGPDVDWHNDAKAREAYLDRLWAFVKTLSHKFNPLKAHVLFHRLEHDRRAGVLDVGRFQEYVRLPRSVSYASTKYLESFSRDERPFGLGSNYQAVTLFPAAGNDEELVRDYLSRIFLDAKDIKPWDTWIQDSFLKQVFATTKMLAGIGDMEQWFSMINDPAYCQALKERVEIGFPRTNPAWFRANDAVTLDVDVKNVATLSVKVFEINALNYFLAHGRDVDTSIDLDGLVASGPEPEGRGWGSGGEAPGNHEQTHKYDEPPMRRVRRTFKFPTLDKPGVYIVEIIGGGISSRALVRKGRLRFVERVGSAGHVFTVLDEDRNILKDASIWLGGREYTAEPDGSIGIPFSNRPGRTTMLLRSGALTTLESFDHQSESYWLYAGLYVDRESLLKKREATVVVRPQLRVNGMIVSLSLLEEPTLVIQSTDRDGVSSSQEVPGLQLVENKETAHTFQVPENLTSISFTLRGKIQNLSQAKKVDLSDSASYSLNAIDSDAYIEDLHLARTADGFVLHHLGKSGEAKPGTVLTITMQHRDLAHQIETTLQTDANGRIELGHLRDVTSLSTSTPSGVSESWTLPRDAVRVNGVLHVKANEPFRVPFLDVAPLGAAKFPDEHGKDQKPEPAVERKDASLLDIVQNTFVRDHFKALVRKDGYLDVAGLPAGDYDLYLKRDGVAYRVRVVPGEDRAGWIAGEKRHAERRNTKPLQISRVTVKEKELEIEIGNANEVTRVHVFGTRYVPAYNAFGQLARAPIPAPRALELFRSPSHYVSGRDIGDEYRYILERKHTTKFAGNMLTRPGLLLNPWAVRSTETATQEAQAGGAYAASPAPSMAAPAPPPMQAQHGGAGAPGTFANLDFLANPAALVLNLKPDEKGVVRVPRETVAHASSLRIVAVDATNTVARDYLQPEVKTPHEDLRLRLALDADKHFSEKKQITVLTGGQTLEIADITTSKTELYGTLSRVYRLFATLSGNSTLVEFGFVLKWPSLTEDEKRAKYSEYACHELSFFISRKDPEFFKRVVQPYLRNKKEKTFLDRYLLGDELAEYRRPWKFGRLNIVERILLGQRVDAEGEPVARHAGDLNDLIAKDIERANHLFLSAIQGSALEAGDALGIGRQTRAAEKVALDALMADMPAMEMAKGMASAGPMPAAKPMAPGGARRSAVSKDMKMKKRERPADDDMDELLDMEKESEPMEEAASGAMGGDSDDFGGRGERDRAARGKVRQLYQKLDKTQEWAENNYWHLTIDQMGPELVTINPFWRDYAKSRGKTPFLSTNIAYASRNFTEMMFALSVLDLPFEVEAPAVAFDGARMKLTPKAVAVAWHKEIKPVEPSAEKVPILVSQNYFRDDDRTLYENDEPIDKYVTGEFLVNVVYTTQVVLTNPTSTNQKLDLLLQIPMGAIPVRNGFITNGRHIELSSYATESLEYAFYFPAPGTFAHFPVHVAKNEQLIAFAEPQRLKVVRELSDVDKTSWAWLSQHGTEKDVLEWMEKNNLDRLAVPDANGTVGLELIAWRMREKGFYEKCVALLAKRHVWNQTLWAYSVHHRDVPNMRELLLHFDHFLDQCGLWLDSPVVKIDAVERGRYQHLEYAPLVNARTQKLGARRTILNDRFSQQYTNLMSSLRYRPKLGDDDRLAVSYYLFLQDRVDEALEMFASVDPKNVDTRLQYDYLHVYALLFREKAGEAKEIAAQHKDYPVDRWKNLFRNGLSQIEEISGAGAKVIDDKDRDQRQANLASTEPDFELGVEKKTVTISAQNLKSVRVNYYRMDIELLFSRQPFVQQQSGQFSFIKPNRSDEIAIEGKTSSFDLPSEYLGANFIVEVVGAGKRKSQAYYAHELLVQTVENFGQVRVSQAATSKPLPKTYVKVYARMKSGEVKFYKDGYTDLRGVFDYTSLNTNELDYVDRFSILVLNDQNGAVIREAAPPKR